MKPKYITKKLKMKPIEAETVFGYHFRQEHAGESVVGVIGLVRWRSDYIGGESEVTAGAHVILK